MASKYAIESVFSLIDRVSNPLKRIGVNSNAVSRRIQRDFIAAQRRLDNLGKAVTKWGRRAVMAAGAAAAAWVGIGVRNAITLADTMASIGSNANITGPPLEQLQKRLSDVANQAGVAVNELAGIANTAIGLGVASSAAADFAGVVARTARVTGAANDMVVAGITNVLAAYGKSADEGNRIAGIMISANRLGRTSFKELNAGMRYVIPTAASLGVQAEEVFAGITALTAGGEKTRDAMQAVGKALSAIRTPSANASALAQHLGIDFSEAALQSRGFAGVMDEIRRKTGGDLRAMEMLFGNERTARAMSILASSGAMAFNEALAEMSTATETVSTEFARVTDTPAQRWQKAINRIQNAGVRLGTSLLPVAERIIGKFSEIADRLSNVDFTQLTLAVDRVFRGGERLAGMLVSVVRFAWRFRGVIIAIVGALGLYHGILMASAIAVSVVTKAKAALKVITAAVTGAQMAYAIVVRKSTAAQSALAFSTKETVAATKIWSATMTKVMAIKKAFTGLTLAQAAALVAAKIATIAATVAQWALNIAMKANPIGLVITAVGALIGLIVLLARKWKSITNAIRRNTERVLAVITIFFPSLGLLISMIREVASNWERVRGAFQGSGILDAIRNIGASIRAFIQPAIDLFMGAWRRITRTIAGVVNTIRSFFASITGRIVGIWQTVSAAVSGFFRGIWEAVTTFLQPVFSWIMAKWQRIVSIFQGSAIINAIKTIGGILISGILAPIQGLLEILSNIPGLGHLAGRGAATIERLRNSLRGKSTEPAAETPTVENYLSAYDRTLQSVEVPNINIDIPDFTMPDLNMERSRIRGVVDISGGAGVTHIPNFTRGNTPGSFVQSQPATPAASVQEAIRTAADGINSTLREILTAVRTTNTATSVSFVSSPVNVTAPIVGNLVPPALPAAPTEDAIRTAAYGIDGTLREILAAVRTTNTATSVSLVSPPVNVAAPIVGNFVPPALPAARTKDAIRSATYGINGTLRDILATARAIETLTHAMSTIPTVSKIAIDTGKPERENADNDNPRNIAPVTREERMAYSIHENRDLLAIEVTAEQGTQARITRTPRSPNIRLVNSGSNR